MGRLLRPDAPVLTTLLLLACAGPDEGITPQPDRAAGERAPLTSTCDDTDEVRCLLPWPSSRFTAQDPATSTGLRVAVEPEAWPVEEDLSWLGLADGFSRLSAVATAFDAALDADGLDGSLLLLVAEPGEPSFGQVVPLELETIVQGNLTPETLIIGRPAEPLVANADHVVVVLDSLRTDAGEPLPDERPTQVALGLEAALNDDEEALRAYHAPTLLLLDATGIEPEAVLRVWDFTTRSTEDPWRRVLALREAVATAGPPSAVVDALELREAPQLLRVTGRLPGCPRFLDDDDALVLGDDGLPVLQGEHEVDFRVFVPEGGGDYPVALYGHGTGGGVTDGSFAEALAGEGWGKANLHWRGWNEDELLGTLTSLGPFLEGSARSTGGVLQSMSDGFCLSRALEGELGDALAAKTLGGEPNPAGGRRPDMAEPMWVGRSMGGTLGAVFAAAHTDIVAGALNVPGGGWSHMIPRSWLYEYGVQAMMAAHYDDEIDQTLALIVAQGVWDEVDGAVWADRAVERGLVFLLQESIGDPIVPNPGTEILARALGAVQLEPAVEVVEGLDAQPGPLATSALEQFRVASDEMFAIHDFVDDDTYAAQAAHEQLAAFATSVAVGAPEIAHPETCTDHGVDGSCDFSE